jgi:site-specific DNA-methyltransferase (adenine-specific)
VQACNNNPKRVILGFRRKRLARQSALKLDHKTFDPKSIVKDGTRIKPVYVSSLGALFSGDCMTVLPSIKDGVVDTVFADPPFNLGKKYGNNFNDLKPEEEYVAWCKLWIAECVRTIKPGGAFFLYNLPKWNVFLGAYLSGLGMEFRHWIAVEISASLPIPGRLHPSHYSLLYYTKGKPKTFRRIRTPIQTCRHCGGEVKDYGGHRDAMNPKGVNLKDVWTDIPPVRHWKFKSKDRRANALSTKILDRVVEMSTDRGNLILDPFGGSGTTFAVCEKKGREWIGVEIDFAEEIIDRIEGGEIHPHKNNDYIEG